MRVSFDGTSADENDHIRTGSSFAKHPPKVLVVARMQNVTIYNAQATGGVTPEPPGYLRDYFGDTVNYQSVPMRQWSVQDEPYGPTVSKPKKPRYCSNLFETFTILSNGDVVKCCEDLNGEYVYGNVFHNSVIELWNKRKHYVSTLRKEYTQNSVVSAGW